MLEHLEAYCTINEIDADQQVSLIQAGKQIVDHDEAMVISYARKGYILLLFQQLVRESIDLEAFINNGEVLGEDLHVQQATTIGSQQPLRRLAPHMIQQSLLADDMWGAHTLFVVEQHIWQAYRHTDQLDIALEERGSRVMTI